MCILLHVTYRNNVSSALATEADSRAQEDHEEADGESGAGQRSTALQTAAGDQEETREKTGVY